MQRAQRSLREEEQLVAAALREPLRAASEAQPEGAAASGAAASGARARAASVPRRVRLRAESASRLQGSVVLFLQAERMHEELERAKNLGLESA